MGYEEELSAKCLGLYILIFWVVISLHYKQMYIFIVSSFIYIASEVYKYLLIGKVLDAKDNDFDDKLVRTYFSNLHKWKRLLFLKAFR